MCGGLCATCLLLLLLELLLPLHPVWLHPGLLLLLLLAYAAGKGHQ
jgi:hypothetical protein